MKYYYKLKKNALDIQQFKSSVRPYNLPDFLNVFTWSMPFLAEKVTKMFYDLLSKTDADGKINLKRDILMLKLILQN